MTSAPRNEVYEAFTADWKRRNPDIAAKSMYRDVRPTYGGNTTARLLYGYCDLNVVPDNPYVRQDFGFNLVKSPEDEKMIIALFQGLKVMGASSEEIDRWRLDGGDSLKEGIRERYEEYGSAEVRGKAWEWFVSNDHIFVASKPRLESEKSCEGSLVLHANGVRD